MTTQAGDIQYVVLVDPTTSQLYKATGTGGTSMSDDAAFTAASSSFTPVGGIVTADSVDSGDGGAFAMLANRQQKITLYDSSGVEITSFGGGTQYTDAGTPPANPVGPTLLWNDGGTWKHVSAANPLPTSATVDTTGLATSAKQDTIIGHIDGVETLLSTIASQQLADGHNVTVDNASIAVTGTFWQATQPVSGTFWQATQPVSLAAAVPVTDNGGNLSIDDGGNVITVDGSGSAGSAAAGVMTVQGIASMTPVQVSQATASNLNMTEASASAIKTAVEIMDDWDESDRAKVNLIAGQAGVAGNIGAVGATVLRMVEAGGTPFYNLDVDESEDAIKGSAGVLRELYCFNRTASMLYVKLYNDTTANVTVGSTTPVRTIPVPGNNDTDGAGVVIRAPMYFSAAITIACTTGFADNDSGAPGANDMMVSGVYD